MLPRFLRVFALVLLAGPPAASLRASVPLPTPAEFVVKTWETDVGLPHNSIGGVVHRKDGFLWIATQAGLVRFDGVEFRTIRSPLISGLRSSSVATLIEENADTLLLSTIQSGLVRVINGVVTPHPLQVIANDGPGKIVNLFREADDVFWVVFRDRRVWRWDHGRVEKFAELAPQPNSSVPVSFARDRTGRVFFARGMNSGIERYENGKLTPVHAPGWPILLASSHGDGPWVATRDQIARLGPHEFVLVAAAPWAGGPMPQALQEDRIGALWIATGDQGLLRWKNGEITRLEIPHNRVNRLDEDNAGDLWISTGGAGLTYVHRTPIILLSGMPAWADSTSGSVCEDTVGNIWFGNWRSVQKLKGGEVDVLNDNPGWPKHALPITPDRAGNVWLAADGQLFMTKPETDAPPTPVYERQNSSIRVLFSARNGDLWIAGDAPYLLRRDAQGQTTRLGEKEGFAAKNVRSIGEGSAGEIWVGTQQGRLFRFADGRFTQPLADGALAGHEIRTLYFDATGTLWIGTAGSGLYVRREGRLARIDEDSGLPDDVISQILEDDFGWMWFGSRRGIFKVAKADLLDCAFGHGADVTPVSFGRADGLPGVSASGSYQPTAWKARNGRLWFVTRKGLVTTDPAEQETQPRPLNVYLGQLLVDGRRVDPTRDPITSSARRLEFRFTAPTFTAPERVRFRYRLDGFDSDWVDAGPQRFAAYSRLHPGKYSFTVIAQQDGHPWAATGPRLSFEIQPMWWETWWARAGAVLLACSGLVLLVRYVSHRRLKSRLARLEQLRRVELERARIARDLHDDLGASLTYASMMAEELSYDWKQMPDPAARSLELASCVRTIVRDLDAVVWTVSPTHDRLSSLSAYICNFAGEYFENTAIECRVHLGAGIPAEPLSPEVRHHVFLIAKELFNNVLKHSQATQVDVSAQFSDGVFELAVSDNGRGFSVEAAAESARNGLKNLRARAGELGATLDLSSSPEGTRVWLRFALEAVRSKKRSTPASPSTATGPMHPAS